MTKTQLAYMAGIVDGEGWIGVSQTRVRKSYRLNAVVALKMTDKPAVALFHSWIPGYTLKLVGTRKRSTLYLWAAYKQSSVKQVLTSLYPYLRVKRKQARLVLKFLASRRHGDRRRPYSKYELSFPTRLHKLNHCKWCQKRRVVL
jgi:hypothetical protein